MEKEVFNDRAKKFEVHVLASGSKGNATVIKYGKSAVIIDAGISARRIKTGLKDFNIPLDMLEGVFITHEHSDHINGLAQLSKDLALPVYTKADTFKAIQERCKINSKLFVPITKHILDLGDLTVEAFPISHDAVDPIGFSCYGGAQKVTFLTDTGLIDQTMLGNMDESTMLVLEANHDPLMLKFGSYMPSLKQRVAGPKGHLSNEASAQGLLMMKRPPELQVVLAHRSEQNNCIEKIENTLGKILTDAGLRIGTDIQLSHGQPKEYVSMYEA